MVPTKPEEDSDAGTSVRPSGRIGLGGVTGVDTPMLNSGKKDFLFS